ncbi:MAG: UDP-N-acetylmuramoyl-L-alanine--D-glutamate ligase [Clostridiaceae bacterium]|nr:UDP-N-acetylmuramoyl-L-alanine--D-glutamate ligase [Clostridiaceae bacterium]
MNEKLNQFKKDIVTKRVAVLGIGISNTPLIRYLGKMGVQITAFDAAEASALETTMDVLKEFDIKYSLGPNYLDGLHGFDVIFKTPKVRFDIPALLREAEAGVEITSEMEVFCKLCPARVFAVTGSDGKTTTTTLIYRILTQHGYKCWLGGNIGTPLLDRIDEIAQDDMVILELSSFQLHTMRNRIHTAVVTNLSPNHLDVHTSMQEYSDAKKNIFLYQSEFDTLVANYDNDTTRKFTEEAPGKVIFFSRGKSLDEGVILSGNRIFYRTGRQEHHIIDTEDIFIPGLHNVENYMAAIGATIDFVDAGDVKAVATTFRGVEHRNEHVRDLNGVSFYNDSIGSSPTRTIASLNAFKKPVILIAGGYDKNIPYDVLGETLVDRVKCLVLLGQTAGKIEKALQDEIGRTGRGADIPVIHCASMEEAVKCAYERALNGVAKDRAVKDGVEKDRAVKDGVSDASVDRKKNASEDKIKDVSEDTSGNEIVLLSPASASFDMYKSFEARGQDFKKIVNSI